jgi:hypothetical protein
MHRLLIENGHKKVLFFDYDASKNYMYTIKSFDQMPYRLKGNAKPLETEGFGSNPDTSGDSSQNPDVPGEETSDFYESENIMISTDDASLIAKKLSDALSSAEKTAAVFPVAVFGYIRFDVERMLNAVLSKSKGLKREGGATVFYADNLGEFESLKRLGKLPEFQTGDTLDYDLKRLKAQGQFLEIKGLYKGEVANFLIREKYIELNVSLRCLKGNKIYRLAELICNRLNARKDAAFLKRPMACLREEMKKTEFSKWLESSIEKAHLSSIIRPADENGIDIERLGGKPLRIEHEKIDKGARSFMPLCRGELEKLKNPERAEGAEGAVIFLETDIGSGTAFLIDPIGHAVTCRHVVAGAWRLNAFTVYGGARTPIAGCKLLKESSEYDLALIKLEGGAFSYIKLADANYKLNLSDEVRLLGFPFLEEDDIKPDDKGNGLTAFDATIARVGCKCLLNRIALPGNSGGPVILKDTGEAVGVFLGAEYQLQTIKKNGEELKTFIAVPCMLAIKCVWESFTYTRSSY